MRGNFVNERCPEIRYHYLGTDDAGQGQSDGWFDKAVAIAEDVRRRGGKLLVHCHMGINRAPSLAYRLLLEVGEHPIEALDLIRAKRPIAGIGYAADAISHYLRGQGEDEIIIEVWVAAVNNWYRENSANTGLAIRAIRASANYS